MIILCGCVILLGLALLNERATKRSAAEGHRAMALAYAGQEAMFDKAEIVRALGMRRAMVARQIADRRAGLAASATTQLVASRYSGLVKFARMILRSLQLRARAALVINTGISVNSLFRRCVDPARQRP